VAKGNYALSELLYFSLFSTGVVYLTYENFFSSENNRMSEMGSGFGKRPTKLRKQVNFGKRKESWEYCHSQAVKLAKLKATRSRVFFEKTNKIS